MSGEHAIVTVFHASRRLFFFCYTPKNAKRLFTKISVRKLEDMIAPNTVERLRDARPAPQTKEELYLRLVELLCFDTREQVSDAEVLRMRRVTALPRMLRLSTVGARRGHEWARNMRTNSSTTIEQRRKRQRGGKRLVLRRRLERLLRQITFVGNVPVLLTVSEEACDDSCLRTVNIEGVRLACGKEDGLRCVRGGRRRRRKASPSKR